MNVAFYFVPETALTTSYLRKQKCGVLLCLQDRLDFFFSLYFIGKISPNSKTKTSFKTATKLKAQSKCGEMFFFFLNPEILQLLN
jgi:hypothetical protein